MTSKTKRGSAQKAASTRSPRNQNKLPPGPGGLFKRAGARANKVIGWYDKLNPEAGPRSDGFLLMNLLHDLMHLCDREPTLGDFHDEYAWAVHMYDTLVEESDELAG